MQRFMLKSKIHRATITRADLNYEGSMSIDQDLLDAAGIMVYEKISVYNINCGTRIETYAISGERGKGEICLNGAAARMGHKGDKVIIATYAALEEHEMADHKPTVLVMNDDNTINYIKCEI
jgi:aspartate 1-decarboxylase